MSEFTLQFTCHTCGSTEYTKEGRIIRCKHCGNRYRENFFDDPNYFILQSAVLERQQAEFEKARRQYADLIKKYGDAPHMEEVYWGHFLCEQYVIFYQNDAGQSIPSFWNINEEPCEKSKAYQTALKYGEKSGNRDHYERVAAQLEDYKRKYRQVKKEFPEGSEIFICFKDTGTDDKNLGYRIYNEFAGKYRIFFSKESLNSISGNDYEPYIYHALNTAKVLLVLCSSRDNLESKWVHNEWWRFHKFAKGTDKTIIPIFRRHFNVSELPDELRNCQGHPEDVGLISVLSNRLSAILKNATSSGKPLTSFEKDLNRIEADWSAGNVDDAKIKLNALIKDSAGKPYDNISALLLQVKFLSSGYKHLKNQNAKASLEKAEELARKNDIDIKDIPEYQKYRAAVTKGRVKIALLGVLAALVIAAATFFIIKALEDPMESIRMTTTETIDVEYGSNIVSYISTITTVSSKGKTEEVAVNESMISGYDPSKIGAQTITITYNGFTTQATINVVRYLITTPNALTFENGKITWESVPRAESYTLLVNNETEITGILTNSYDVSPFSEPGQYTVKVKAIADSSVGRDSDYSQSITILSLKEASNITIADNILSWNEVANCQQYEIYCNDRKLGYTTTTSYTVPYTEFTSGANTFYVIPVDASNIKLVTDASGNEIQHPDHNSEMTVYCLKQSPSLNYTSEGRLEWEAAVGATSYTVYLNDKAIATTDTNSYVPADWNLTTGANTVYVVPSDGCHFIDTVTDGFDFEHNSEIKLYKYNYAPNLAYTSGQFVWDSVAGASRYSLYVNGTFWTSVNSNSVYPSEWPLKSGENHIAVVPNVDRYVTEAPENADFANDGLIKLFKYDNATGVRFDTSILSWDEAAGNAAAGYDIYINGEFYVTTTYTSYQFPGDVPLHVGRNSVKVVPKEGCNIKLAAIEGSDFANAGEIELYRYAKATNLRFEDGMLRWDFAAGVSASYVIYCNGIILTSTFNSYYDPDDWSELDIGENTIYVGVEDGYIVTTEADDGTDFENDGDITLYNYKRATGLEWKDGTLTWNQVYGNASFDIYLNGALWGTSATNSYTPSNDTLLTSSNEIYVVVKSGANLTTEADAGADFENDGAITVTRLDKPSGFTLTANKLTWNAVTGATKYEVYKNGAVIATVPSASYSITHDNSYAHSDVYTVRALADVNVVNSAISSEGITLTYLAAPLGVNVQSDVLTWNAVSGATGYEIYCNNSLFETVDDSTLSLNLLGRLEKGSYSVCVIAKGDGNTLISSAKSDNKQYEVSGDVVYITTADQLKNIANDLGGVYVLGSNITLDGAWTPIGTTAKPFTGRFNGGGYTISGLNVTASGANGTGFFAVIGASAIVENVKFDGVTVTSTGYDRIGIVAGTNSGTVRNVEVWGEVSAATRNNVGGIVGYNFGSLVGCINHATVSGKNNVGGIAGNTSIESTTSLEGCKNLGTVNGVKNVGGIGGNVTLEETLTISGMINEGTITASGDYAGGIFGYLNNKALSDIILNSSSNSGNVSANDYAAGCIGYAKGSITVMVSNPINPSLVCTNTGVITATGGTNTDDIYLK